MIIAGAGGAAHLAGVMAAHTTLPVIGVSCIVMAALLAIAEFYCNHTRALDHVSLKDAMIVGFAQVGALIPGVSRSGSTLTAALFLDLKREEAARFSFLLGLPAIALAGLKELWELHKAHLDAHGWSVLSLGLFVASISAFAAIYALVVGGAVLAGDTLRIGPDGQISFMRSDTNMIPLPLGANNHLWALIQ